MGKVVGELNLNDAINLLGANLEGSSVFLIAPKDFNTAQTVIIGDLRKNETANNLRFLVLQGKSVKDVGYNSLSLYYSGSDFYVYKASDISEDDSNLIITNEAQQTIVLSKQDIKFISNNIKLENFSSQYSVLLKDTNKNIAEQTIAGQKNKCLVVKENEDGITF